MEASLALLSENEHVTFILKGRLVLSLFSVEAQHNPHIHKHHIVWVYSVFVYLLAKIASFVATASVPESVNVFIIYVE